MDTTVGEIMRTDFEALEKSDSLIKAIDLFLNNPDMVFPVIDKKGRIIGEVSQHELLKLAIPEKYVDSGRILGPAGIKNLLGHSGTKVADLMTTHDIKVKEDSRVIDAARIMMETDVRTLEVINKDNEPIGFVSELDILFYLKNKLKKKGK